MADIPAEKQNAPAPPYQSQEQQHTPPSMGHQTTDTINRGSAVSPGPQMAMTPNAAPSQQPEMTQLNLLREQPEHIYCPRVGRVCLTKSESKDSEKTWFAVIGICLICPCVACIPLKGCCGDGMLQDWDHYCTGCGKQLTHRPYNREAQILAPDHAAVNSGSFPQMQYQSPVSSQPQYAQQQH
ncbi:uncharacterized protein SEPMUDRAFT_151702 [Sphaerulina musiva SO2202]|uniref:LITAF domain-containing protein n=1 Tax=Sphaerulina musiva (strain SO2202) TaxID=692275 RepID=M3BRL2_SPHMS|nr:uncharacterized protein SEPMUDRAFT_151702 [Sphaerulina musiva SO2202]EMF08758.1 hypothetical protein SEPMUDRAFT_151702 [Sphaerulina musiva SO2202]